jgi:hypothetical protein
VYETFSPEGLLKKKNHRKKLNDMLQLQFKFELTLTHSKSVFLVKVAILDGMYLVTSKFKMVSITLKQFFKWHKYINFKIESAEI